MDGIEWKVPVFDEDEGQVVRVFRPSEVRMLIANVDIKDDKTWKWLDQHNIRNQDIRLWLQAALFTGMRFPELARLHLRPDLLEVDGNISMQYYPGGKEKRTIKARTIYMSNIGRKIIPEFFKARPLPTDTRLETRQTLTALGSIMHGAGNRIGLQTREFIKVRRHDARGPNGEIIKDAKGKAKKEKEEYHYTTNGCTFRSMRKTWESWLFIAFQNEPQIFGKIFHSQGHTQQTAQGHYLNFRFDAEDLLEIRKMVEGFGIPQMATYNLS